MNKQTAHGLQGQQVPHCKRAACSLLLGREGGYCNIIKCSKKKVQQKIDMLLVLQDMRLFRGVIQFNSKGQYLFYYKFDIEYQDISNRFRKKTFNISKNKSKGMCLMLIRDKFDEYCVRQRGCSLTHSARTPPAVQPGTTIWVE